MKKILFLFVVLIVALAAVKISQDYSFVEKLTFWSNKKTAILHDQTFSLTVAATDKEKQIGLSKKESLEKNEGMLFLFDSPGYHSFWMKDMKFSIDIIFLRERKIVTIVSRVSPPPDANQELTIYKPDEPSDMVIEVAAGRAEKLGLQKGDEVKISL